jgi:hypothetical protein
MDELGVCPDISYPGYGASNTKEHHHQPIDELGVRPNLIKTWILSVTLQNLTTISFTGGVLSSVVFAGPYLGQVRLA